MLEIIMTLTEEVAIKEIYVDEKEARIAGHLASIDPVLIPYTKTLAQPSYKDLSHPEQFSRHYEKLKPTDLVAVHLTDTFPKDGIIRPTVHYDPAVLRFSLHLTINSEAEDVEFHGAKWSWKDKRYAVLIPFEKIISRVDEYNPGDTIVVDDLELPEGTVVLTDKDNHEDLRSAGKAQILKADYSQSGKKINGFQRAIYEQMVKMGYFPQLSDVNCGWYSGEWSSYRQVHVDFCHENGLIMGIGHRGHWSSKMEDFSLYLERIFQEESEKGESKEEKFRNAVEEANDRFLREKDQYEPNIPGKYKQALILLLQRYGQQFPQVKLPDLSKS